MTRALSSSPAALAALVVSVPLALPFAFAGCGGKVDTLAFSYTTQGVSIPLDSLDDCPLLAGRVGLQAEYFSIEFKNLNLLALEFV